MSNPIDNIIKVIEDAPAQFNKAIPDIERRMLDELTGLLKNLQVKNSRIVSNMANLKLVNGIKKKLEKLVISKQYLKDVTDFVRAYDSVTKYTNAYFAGISDKFKPSAYYTAVKNAAINNTIDGLAQSGIGANVINPIKDMLLTAVTSGQSYASLSKSLSDEIVGNKETPGSLSRYAITYTVTAISQFNGQYIAAINNDLGFRWYRYRGSNKKTSREFCIHMAKKGYVHESEFATIISGNVDGHKCKIYEKTGLPYGMMDGTNPTNFVSRKGGWNCEHGMYPLPDYSVPKEIRDKLGK